MKESMPFYTLKIIGGNSFHHYGDILRTTADVLHVGESADCEVRYEGEQSALLTDIVSPVYYATILKDEDGDGWHIVKRSMHTDVAIVGEGDFGYVYQLKDGDVLHFGQQRMALQFQVGKSSKHLFRGTVVEHRTPHLTLFYSLFALLAVVIAGLVCWQYSERKDLAISMEDIREMESSVYLLKVDSVQWICAVNGKDSILQRRTLSNQDDIMGTAFLTDDGKLVTARHCIEYWLVNQFDLRTSIDSLEEINRWAVLTEDYNMGHASANGSFWQIRVFCSVYSKDNLSEPAFQFCSTDDSVHINKAHDELIPLADLSHCYYWRTVRPYFLNREMELGDISYVDVSVKGNIPLADKKQLQSVSSKNHLAVCGFPITDASGTTNKNLVFSQAQMKQDTIASTSNFMFEGTINHGYSGGPIFARIDDDIVVIGVVSRADRKSKETFKWAVPISEVRQMEKKATAKGRLLKQRKEVHS